MASVSAATRSPLENTRFTSIFGVTVLEQSPHRCQELVDHHVPAGRHPGARDGGAHRFPAPVRVKARSQRLQIARAQCLEELPDQLLVTRLTVGHASPPDVSRARRPADPAPVPSEARSRRERAGDWERFAAGSGGQHLSGRAATRPCLTFDGAPAAERVLFDHRPAGGAVRRAPGQPADRCGRVRRRARHRVRRDGGPRRSAPDRPHLRRAGRGSRRRHRRHAGGGGGRQRRQRLGPDVPPASRGQAQGPVEGAAQDPRRPVHGLHAGRGPSVPRHRRASRGRAAADDQAQQRRRRH